MAIIYNPDLLDHLPYNPDRFRWVRLSIVRATVAHAELREGSAERVRLV